MIVRLVRSIRRAIARAKLMGHLSSQGPLTIGPGLRAARGAKLTTDLDVSIGADCTVMALVDIGPDVMVSSKVSFIGDDHPFQGLDGPITSHRPNSLARIRLEGDNLIGFGAILIGPLNVGRGAIVGAGAVVTTDLRSDTVYGGVPARPIAVRQRARDDKAIGRGHH
jgi:chloramphenicol O-acetyltransferase type B